MLQKTLAISLVFTISALPSMAFAADPDSVAIDEIASPNCGEQALTFTGSGTYSEGTQHLVVDLDGTQLMDNHNEPANWSTGAVTVGVGSHTLTATIFDKSDHEDVMAQDTADFTVPACGGGDEGTTTGGEGGGGDEQDCCPGPDPLTPSTGGKVKGAVKRTVLPASLRPLNSIFRMVYGRSPTFQEWSYWAKRLRSDKKHYDALFGAMQWHQLRGHTTDK